MPVSIVILNCDGLEFLKKCVPSVERAVQRYGDNCEIIVVDNSSQDASLDYLSSNFAQVRVIGLPENLGFTKAMNIGFRQARYPIVIGLNNDVFVDEDFISPMVSHFSEDGNIFAVAAKMFLWDKKTLNFGRAVGSFKFGIFRRKFVDSSSPLYALYACGGGFAVDRVKFLELGGFDEDMIFYWEDVDLCYRAWKRGWTTVYEPKSIIYHKQHGTNIKKYGESGIKKMSGEDYFLFVLKNIHDKRFFYKHLFFMPVLILISILIGKPHFAKGLFSSLRRWPAFSKKRKIERSYSKICDREVFRISSQ
jgi:GT2 family glycosyltransferase